LLFSVNLMQYSLYCWKHHEGKLHRIFHGFLFEGQSLKENKEVGTVCFEVRIKKEIENWNTNVFPCKLIFYPCIKQLWPQCRLGERMSFGTNKIERETRREATLLGSSKRPPSLCSFVLYYTIVGKQKSKHEESLYWSEEQNWFLSPSSFG
jgi:hypothetical protein